MEPVILRTRISQHDAHYGGGLVDGAKMLQFFGDVATALLIAHDGDEGLFRSYDDVEFLAPVYSGDFIEVEGSITNEGNSSRKMRFEARKIISPLSSDHTDYRGPSSADWLAEPIVVCRARGTCVTPVALQRGRNSAQSGGD